MEYLVSTGQRGLTVAANATTLNGAITDVATTVIVSHADVFVAGDTVTIDQEDITLTATADNLTFNACVRGVNSTTGAAHVTGANVRLAAGEELVTHTFDGSEEMIGVRCGADVVAMFAVEYDGAIVHLEQTTNVNLAIFFPMRSLTPLNTKVLRVLAWLFRAEAVNGVCSAFVMGS